MKSKLSGSLFVGIFALTTLALGQDSANETETSIASTYPHHIILPPERTAIIHAAQSEIDIWVTWEMDVRFDDPELAVTLGTEPDAPKHPLYHHAPFRAQGVVSVELPKRLLVNRRGGGVRAVVRWRYLNKD